MRARYSTRREVFYTDYHRCQQFIECQPQRYPFISNEIKFQYFRIRIIIACILEHDRNVKTNHKCDGYFEYLSSAVSQILTYFSFQECLYQHALLQEMDDSFTFKLNVISRDLPSLKWKLDEKTYHCIWLNLTAKPYDSNFSKIVWGDTLDFVSSCFHSRSDFYSMLGVFDHCIQASEVRRAIIVLELICVVWASKINQSDFTLTDHIILPVNEKARERGEQNMKTIIEFANKASDSLDPQLVDSALECAYYMLNYFK